VSVKTRIRALEKRLGTAEYGPPLPDIVCSCVKPLFDAAGNSVYGGQPCNAVRARMDYGPEQTFYDRGADESLEDFQKRVLASHPRGKFARILTMLLPPKEAE
jgi:hypothetical protein